MLVIVDLNMPGIDGPAAARRLRESGYRSPILVLSGAARREDIEYALASGCTEFIRKPPQISALKRMIQLLALSVNEADSAKTPSTA
jgi:two-component system CheB/CheR fusion protein